MKNIKFILIASLFSLTLTSCAEAFYSVILPKKPHPKKFQKFSDGENKEIVIVPMVHLAKPKFYSTSTKIINNLRSDNYTIFYEKVTYPKNADSLSLDTLKRKIRKIVGIPLGLDLTDPNYKSYPKFFSSGRYVMQTAENAGYSIEKDVNVDLNVTELIIEHEKKYGEIELTECDLKTKLKARYWCDDVKENKHTIKTVREDFIIINVLKSKKEKIALVYGKLHYKGLKERLINEGFEKVKY